MKCKSIVIFTIYFCLLICSSLAGLIGRPTEVNILYEDGHGTRLGSVDGPLAGEDIYAQAFAGVTPASLQPVGDSRFHRSDSNGNPMGLICMCVTMIPHIPHHTSGFVQVAAWDSTVWGKDFSQVPVSQLGFSDVAPFAGFGGIPQPPSSAFLSESIIVPAIPEPSTWALIGMGALFMLSRLLTGRKMN